ncbi:hypothetical protein PI172_0255 [Prevotella intermedia]|uniref:Uncharacterized protein n=1 Tax=Prevotella intermedia TaxID=28131 RepID=A0AAD1F6A3_PREIN|nr:hypothetical protein PI172_0255 [Prevotella intermedia]
MGVTDCSLNVKLLADTTTNQSSHSHKETACNYCFDYIFHYVKI